MSERISEILEVLRHIAARFEPGMSKDKVSELRLEAMSYVAQQRKIRPSTVSDKFRRRLRPTIDGTQQFDDALYDWLNSGTDKLQHALEQSADHWEDRTEINELFDGYAIQQQVAKDLVSQREEDAEPEERVVTEGERKVRLVSYFERKSKLRVRAIKFHGTTCKGCGFNFEAAYGVHGKNYIEVHHVVPLATLPEESAINHEADLTVLCSNCHRMVHRKSDAPLSIEELKKIVRSRLR